MMKVYGITLIILSVFLMTACQMNSEIDKSPEKQEEEKTLNQKLIKAAEQSDKKTILNLVEKGADINATNEQGRTAVMIATRNNDPAIVKILIEQGADIDIRDHNKDNVLLYAGASGYLDIVKLAIEAEADTTITNRYGGTALIPAAERGHVDVVEELLQHSNTDVNHVNNLDWTALLEAIILSDGGKKHQKIVQLLIDHGADVTISDKEGITPLNHAKEREYEEIEDILKKAGA